jgi:hypothetical protein
MKDCTKGFVSESSGFGCLLRLLTVKGLEQTYQQLAFNVETALILLELLLELELLILYHGPTNLLVGKALVFAGMRLYSCHLLITYMLYSDARTCL